MILLGRRQPFPGECDLAFVEPVAPGNVAHRFRPDHPDLKLPVLHAESGVIGVRLRIVQMLHARVQEHAEPEIDGTAGEDTQRNHAPFVKLRGKQRQPQRFHRNQREMSDAEVIAFARRGDPHNHRKPDQPEPEGPLRPTPLPTAESLDQEPDHQRTADQPHHEDHVRLVNDESVIAHGRRLVRNADSGPAGSDRAGRWARRNRRDCPRS